MISISIIIPAYNEEKTILKILEKLKKIKLKSDIEIIIINDGSTDNTKKIIDENSKYFDKVKHLTHNQGKGKAIIEGLKLSSKEYIFFQDADTEYNPNDIIDFIHIAENDNFDFIMGSRFTSARRNVLHFWHMLGNKLITSLFNILNNTTFTDIYCCYCLFKKKNLPIHKLKSFRWGQQAEILTYLSLNSNKVFEIAVSYEGRKYEEGKKIKYYNIFEVLYWIIWTKLKILIN